MAIYVPPVIAPPTVIAPPRPKRAQIAAKNAAASSTDCVPTIRVLVVDDHPIARKGVWLSLLTCPDMTLVGEAGSGEEALRLVELLRPNVVVMDLVMPGMGGIPAIRVLRERAPQVKIVVLTNMEAEEPVREAIQAGAIGYQLKRAAPEALIQSIRAAAEDQWSLDPIAVEALIQTTKRGHSPDHELTERERDVLGQLVHGLSNAAIAKELTVSVATVKFHLRGIGRKLGVSTRTQIVSVALHRYLIPTG